MMPTQRMLLQASQSTPLCTNSNYGIYSSPSASAWVYTESQGTARHTGPRRLQPTQSTHCSSSLTQPPPPRPTTRSPPPAACMTKQPRSCTSGRWQRPTAHTHSCKKPCGTRNKTHAKSHIPCAPVLSMVLRREGMGPLATANPSKAIANQVVLLLGAARGSYKVGSVRFANGTRSLLAR